MRLSLRFVVPLLVALGMFAYIAVPLADTLMKRWFARDLGLRSSLIAAAVQEPLTRLIADGSKPGIVDLFDRMILDDRLYAVGVCSDAHSSPIATKNFPRALNCATLFGYGKGDGSEHVLASPQGPLQVAVRDIDSAGRPEARLILVHDLNFVARRSEETRQYLFYFFVTLGACIALITVVIAQLSWRAWVAGFRALLRGEGVLRHAGARTFPELRPIARDLHDLVRDLQRQYRPLDGGQRIWDQDGLRATLRSELLGNDVIAVSNREPYIHVRTDRGVRVQRPASGLVTALEPVMRACSGTWIAHGSGSADRETSDRNDRIAVPPEQPLYRIRRIWLSEEEEAGYYAGFANEGLWPLCHNAHVRPMFRSSDWEHYQCVNAKFAAALVDEAATKDPIVLAQDYHLSLLPRMIHDRLSAATILTFWHIPWPNPESFSICPWRNGIVEGLLGSSILGFQTQVHCNNFLDTVDRMLEARVDRENFSVTYRGNVTLVNRYPISIEWPPRVLAGQPSIADSRAAIRERLDLPREHRLGIGVDRLDYTKGIIERMNATARLLELEPRWIGQFTFVQIAAPSRGGIHEYRSYDAKVRQYAAEINARYPQARCPPVMLITEHHEPEAVYQYYRASDLCFVGSLHDGMNLVAKEFVASRDDEKGVLILSQFAGASRELPEALIVNPYDADQCARALSVALAMPESDQRARMRFMRGVVREFNVYRWAGRMLLDAAVMRQRGRLRMRDVKGGVEAWPG